MGKTKSVTSSLLILRVQWISEFSQNGYKVIIFLIALLLRNLYRYLYFIDKD